MIGVILSQLVVKLNLIIKRKYMKCIFIIILILFLNQVQGQNLRSPEDWFESYLEYYSLDTIDYKKDLISLDYSDLFLEIQSKYIYGIIGKNFQRIQIKWISINKDPFNPDLYYVYGKTKVKENICDFTGVFKIRTIRLHILEEFDMPYRVKIKPDKIGVLFCDYILTENSDIESTGVFKGISASEFYIHNDSLKYNDLRSGADDMTNNSFIGEWTSYNTNKSIVCQWGDFRVPNIVSGFDCGAACFSPCNEFKNYGWQNFISIEDWKHPDYNKINEWWK